MPINWHHEGYFSWCKIIIYKFMCLLMTLSFHFGMKGNYIWDCGKPHERVATEEEFNRIMKDIHYEFVKNGGKIQYSHNVWCNIGHFHWQGPVSLTGDQLMWDLWSKNWHRTCFFPSTSVLPSHYHSIHILLPHTHLFIACLFNPSNGQCYLMRTLTKGLRHWKNHSFCGDYF